MNPNLFTNFVPISINRHDTLGGDLVLPCPLPRPPPPQRRPQSVEGWEQKHVEHSRRRRTRIRVASHNLEGGMQPRPGSRIPHIFILEVQSHYMERRFRWVEGERDRHPIARQGLTKQLGKTAKTNRNRSTKMTR
jgi:hypothetical protein